MVEALPKSHEELENNRKPFTLRATGRYVGRIGGKETGQFPHFEVPLSVGEERMIDTFSFIVESCCPQTGSVEVSVGQICESTAGLSLDDVNLQGNLLKIGDIAQIALRRFRFNGRPIFHFAAEKDVKVLSRERFYQQSTPQIIPAS